ncbi:MAG: acetyl-CoA C-acyltransferase [Spirochaetota bacterium]
MSKRQVVIVSGARTPFVKAFAEYTSLDTIDLGTIAVNGLLQKTGINKAEIQALYWGGVVLPSAYPNIAREIAIDTGLPRSADSFTVSRACTSGLLSITLAHSAIERGDIDVAIAGGGDSTSSAEVSLPQKLTKTIAPLVMSKKTTPMDWLAVASQINPITDILPRPPRIVERSTGQLMGESAEDMAKRNAISQLEQDQFALRSHQNAARAIKTGRLAEEIIPVDFKKAKKVYSDGIVRGDVTLRKLSSLKPVFAKDGTLTAGNSSPLTDGAACVLLMSLEKAKSLGLKPLAKIRSFDYVGVDPFDQLLIGPAISMPQALKKAGMSLQDIDLVDIHEAFAAQVLSVMKALASKSFAEKKLGMDKAVGEIDTNKLNIHGGSISLGHPFAATGARMAYTMANELSKNGKETALLGVCAAGGLGAAAVLEAV